MIRLRGSYQRDAAGVLCAVVRLEERDTVDEAWKADESRAAVVSVPFERHAESAIGAMQCAAQLWTSLPLVDVDPSPTDVELHEPDGAA